MINNLIDSALDLRACANVKVVSKDVRGHGAQILGETPNMQVVNTKHSLDLHHILDQFTCINIARRSFEQLLDRD